METKPKYHVGDRVVILDYMEPGVTKEDQCCFINSMAQYKGMTTIVTGYRKYRSGRYSIEIDGGEWSWVEQWLTDARGSIEEML